MSTQQILIRLPEDVAARFKAAVPARQRNKFVADLVARAVASQEDELTRIAVAVTDEERSNPELAPNGADVCPEVLYSFASGKPIVINGERVLN